jgi:hypothetical protein
VDATGKAPASSWPSNALVPDKPRRKAHVQRVRADFLDLDAPRDTLPPFPLEPQLVVESSPGRHHVYWLVERLPVDQFTPLQKALARRYQGDPVVSDACRASSIASTQGGPSWRA